ncbi:MAG: Copper-exporting P-type ATPase [Thermoanaerobaculia bacterium]|nr:Copper-exporting P-type ATPase [Thermoanaerobaculia bacterium]
MNPRGERPIPSGAEAACAHCGLEVPERLVRPDEARQFCCAGCRQVFTIINEWGYGQYYRLADQQGARNQPARVTGRTFADFDDPAVASETSEALTAGRCRTRLYLEGVHCAACVWLVEKIPEALPGVDSVRLNLGNGVAEVTWEPGRVALSVIGRTLDSLGYTPHVHRTGKIQEVRRKEDRAALVKLGVAGACAMNLMFLHGAIYAGEYSGMATPFETFFRWVSLGVSLPVMLFSARPFFTSAVAGLRSRMVHIDLPIALGIATGFLYSAWNTVAGKGPLYFDSLAMLVAALLGARQLQRAAQRAALERADGLRGAAFIEFARKLTGPSLDSPAIEWNVNGLAPGDRVEVLSGDLVPVDGTVLSGRSTLDNAVLTGESVPVAVREGDSVSAGATNLGARLVVSVEASGKKTRVGALLALVEEALSRRPAVLELTDTLARRFVKVLLAVAVLTAVIWFPAGPSVALHRVIALLVVACPCALGLSVPLAVSVTLLRAARAGIFVKNPDALQKLRTVSTVLLDKTGTLTEGRTTISRWAGSDTARELACALEEESSHTVAEGFRTAFGRTLRAVRRVENVRESAGQGISGDVDGRAVAVGNLAHMAASGACVPEALAVHADTLLGDGLSPVYVAVDGRVEGVGGAGDPIRAGARQTVARLLSLGIRVRIISGDHAAVVRSVGAKLGVPEEDALGGLTPEAKRDLVRSLVESPGRKGSVVMVGDGVNDAAALALADVGVAVHGGTGASIAAADVVLTREGVTPLLEVLKGARRFHGLIRRNLVFSVLYNATGATLAVLGVMGPLLAAILMPASSLTVILSSALARTFAGDEKRASFEREAGV